ncbi:hypothetical protein BJ322DRAFT_1207109, partial [Thelephora terrestris]
MGATGEEALGTLRGSPIPPGSSTAPHPPPTSNPPPPLSPRPPPLSFMISQAAPTQLPPDDPPKLAPMRVGHVANFFTFSVPKKIDDAFKKLRYVDYSLLARSSREAPAKEEGSLVWTDGQVGIKSKVMSALDEGDIDLIDWGAASETAEMKIREYHGAARAEQLRAHHRNVVLISRSYAWAPARSYDKQIRQLVASDTAHDLTDLNQITSQWYAEKAQAGSSSQQARLLHPSRPLPSSLSSSSSSWAGSTGGNPSAKRFT